MVSSKFGYRGNLQRTPPICHKPPGVAPLPPPGSGCPDLLPAILHWLLAWDITLPEGRTLYVSHVTTAWNAIDTWEGEQTDIAPVNGGFLQLTSQVEYIWHPTICDQSARFSQRYQNNSPTAFCSRTNIYNSGSPFAYTEILIPSVFYPGHVDVSGSP